MKISEKEIIDSFIGKKVNEERLNEIFKENGPSCYIAHCFNLHPRFGITDKLYGDWECGCIDYSVSVFLKDGTIERGFTEKEREGCCGHGRPVAHILKPSQQELRVARRILEYITE